MTRRGLKNWQLQCLRLSQIRVRRLNILLLQACEKVRRQLRSHFSSNHHNVTEAKPKSSFQHDNKKISKHSLTVQRPISNICMEYTIKTPIPPIA